MRKAEQKAEKEWQDQQNIEKVMALMSCFADMEWATAKFILEKNNYDLQKAKFQVFQEQQFALTLVNKVTNQ